MLPFVFKTEAFKKTYPAKLREFNDTILKVEPIHRQVDELANAPRPPRSLSRPFPSPTIPLLHLFLAHSQRPPFPSATSAVPPFHILRALCTHRTSAYPSVNSVHSVVQSPLSQSRKREAPLLGPRHHRHSGRLFCTTWRDSGCRHLHRTTSLR